MSVEAPLNETATRPRTARKGRRAAFTLLVVVLLVAAGAVVAGFLLSPPSATPTEVEFEVMPGWGGRQVAAALREEGLIRSPFAFTLYLRLKDLDHSIGAGLYDLHPAMSVASIAATLVEGGRPRLVDIVVPEGWRADKIVERLAANGVASERELRDLVNHPGSTLAPPYLPAGRSLEGYLFPAVYEVPLHATAEEALGLMVARFRDELEGFAGFDEQGDGDTGDTGDSGDSGDTGGTGDLAAVLRERRLTVHSWVTLASMVQAEAASADEMGIIAGVFVNRLELGMPLQSDPTVAYGLGKELPELSVSAGDLALDTPWNTYTRPGLPFGPIGNPGAHALRAVLAPERYAADGALYLFFLHGTTGGEPIFRPNSNLPAHNRDVEAYLRNDGPPADTMSR
ncbi:MAG TPA: endolytic transglycosylase MltG [Trueperaceae bacterium]|nr:endolytic transglycosylase MltG [Trueperaceae bacterium]